MMRVFAPPAAGGASGPGVGDRARHFVGAWVERMKIRHRAVICPFPELLAFVRVGDRVCDIGCGAGQFMLLIKRVTSVRAMLGIEIDSHLVGTAATVLDSPPRAVACDLRVYDGFDFPDDVGGCNVVFLVDVLHHVPAHQQQQFLNRLYDAIAAGTRVVIKDIDASSVLVLCNKLHDLVLSGAPGQERTLQQARDMCRQAGFHIVAAFTRRKIVYPHYFVILDKLAAGPAVEGFQ